MTDTPTTDPESRRLEDLWAGDFGDAYIERNTGVHGPRGEFWSSMLERTEAETVLEVGCNVGGNLAWLAEQRDQRSLWGIDVNTTALATLRARLPGVNAVWSPARRLPFRDAMFDMVFTMGVLIHQPETTLPLVMAEMARCSSRHLLCGEYFADQTTEVAYRDQSGALFRRDYGTIFREVVPELALVDQGFLGRDQGWDDITWWLFELGHRS